MVGWGEQEQAAIHWFIFQLPGMTGEARSWKLIQVVTWVAETQLLELSPSFPWSKQEAESGAELDVEFRESDVEPRCFNY